MAKIRFENGVVVNFNGNPTPQDIEEVAQKLGISKKKSSFGQDIKESFKSRTDKLSESYLRQQQGKQSVGESILQTVGQGAGLIGDVAFSGVSRLASAITPDAIEKPVVEAGKKLMTKAVSTPLVSGAVSKYQKFAEEQPRASANIGAVGNIASMIPVGKAGSVAGKVVGKTALNTAKVVGKAGEQVATKGANLSKFGISQASGLNRETIEQIIKNPQMFTKEVVGDMTRENIGKQIKTGITNRINQLQSVGKEYEPLRKLNKVINVPAETYTDAINKYGLKLSGGKLISTAESKPFLSGELKQIEDFISQYASTKHTPNSALNAREALSSLAKFDTGKSNNLTSLAKDLRVNLNKIIQDDKVGISGIKSIDDYYSKEIKLLKDIRKDYFIKGTTDFKDNALSKIANLTKEGRQSVLKRLKEIDPNIDFKVNILRAVEDIKSSGGLKVGTYARGGIAAGGLATGNIPLLLGALAAQPEILVPILRAWGNLRASQKAIVKSIETKLKSGADLLLNEKSALNQAIDYYAKKIGEKTKNIKPGLTIEDVSPKVKGEILKSTPKLDTKNFKTAEDYVKAQPTAYHFTSPETKITKWSTKKSQGRIWFTDKTNVSDNIGASGRGKMYTVRFDKNAKWATPQQANKSYTDQLIADGYDGVFHPDSSGEYGNYYEVFNPKVIKTKSQLILEWNKAQKSNPLIQEAKKIPKTVNVYVKSKFSEGGGYKDVPVIRKVDNVTLYQGSNAGDKRQFWTDSKKYASQFGEVKEKTGSFYQVDNGNRVTDVYIEAPIKKTKSTPLKQVDPLIKEAKKYKTPQEFANEQWKKMTEYKDGHRAPGFDDTPVDEKIDMGGDFSLAEVSQGYSNQPDDYFDPRVGARYYSYDNKPGQESYRALKPIIDGEKDELIAYRTVPKDINQKELQDGDWITFSKDYAKSHGGNRFDGKYKIITQKVNKNNVWWDGNDINEWGFDTGKTWKKFKDIWNKANKK